MEKDKDYSELTGLDKSVFRANRNHFLDKLKLESLRMDSILILEGGVDVPRYDSDIPYFYFQQESYFYYLSGSKYPDCYLIMDLTTGDIVLYIRNANESEKIWVKYPSLDEITQKLGINAKYMESFDIDLLDRDPSCIYVLCGVNSDSGLSSLTAKIKWTKETKYLEERVDKDVQLYEILSDCRVYKTIEEQNILRHTVKLTCEGHKEVMKIVKEGANERAAESKFMSYIYETHGIRIWAYECICGGGTNASYLHYPENNQQLKSGSLLLFDMGARFNGYCADITSTIPVSKKFSEKQKFLYELVLAANYAVREAVKPGVNWTDMHLLAESVLITGLQEINILNKGYSVTEI
jgi:Xaa-Pro dipeptidase